MNKILLLFFTAYLGISLNAKSQCNCDYIIPKNSHPNGELLNIKPGDVLCLDGAIEYNGITFTNIKGTPEKPVIIKNCNGQAFINSTNAYGLKFTYSENFKLMGNGSPDYEYGIKVTTQNNFYITMEFFTTDFEIAHVEVAGSHPENLHISGFAGIGVKTSPYQACDLFKDPTRQAWIMRNISIHDNYIHDTGGEGLYIGHGFYAGKPETQCGEDILYSHSIQNVRIYNNRIINTGFDGIQIKNTDADVKIYNNYVNGYGLNGEIVHDEGLFLGEGVTGEAYNNWIENGNGHGIQFQGMGNNKIYNNVIINCKEDGFYGTGGQFAVRIPDAPYYIYNNTFINVGRDGLVFYDDNGGDKYVINNLFIKYGNQTIRNGATDLHKINNLFFKSFKEAQIYDSLNLKLQPTLNSPAINSGADLAVYGLSLPEDYDGKPRPYGGGYDVGAFEYFPTLSAPEPSNTENNNLKIYPNPVDKKGRLNFNFNSLYPEKGEIKIISQISNAVVFNETINLQAGENQTVLLSEQLGNLESGVYLINYRSDTRNIVEKFLVK